jgi:hypothetical protein
VAATTSGALSQGVAQSLARRRATALYPFLASVVNCCTTSFAAGIEDISATPAGGVGRLSLPVDVLSEPLAQIGVCAQILRGPHAVAGRCLDSVRISGRGNEAIPTIR